MWLFSVFAILHICLRLLHFSLSTHSWLTFFYGFVCSSSLFLEQELRYQTDELHLLFYSVRPSTLFSADTDTLIFCCQPMDDTNSGRYGRYLSFTTFSTKYTSMLNWVAVGPGVPELWKFKVFIIRKAYWRCHGICFSSGSGCGSFLQLACHQNIRHSSRNVRRILDRGVNAPLPPVSLHPYPHTPLKNCTFCMFSLFNFSSIFPGGQLTPFTPMCGRPCRHALASFHNTRWHWRNFVQYLCQLVFAAILWVKLLGMFATVISPNYALLAFS